MSVYKRAGQETYSYDFQLRGRRFSGDTRAKNRREAERFEAQRKEEAKLKLAEEAAFFASEMTFEIAASRWWLEVGQHNANTETTLRNLEWLKAAIGTKTPLTDVTDSIVASLVAKRRGERLKGRADAPFVSPATVNRTCTQPLREIIVRAAKVWKVAVAEIDFGRHMLKEPRERVREASVDEEDAIMGILSRGYDDAVRFAFLTGCRRMEILGLEWPHVDFFSRRFTVTGKGNKIRTLPMSDAIYDLLWDQKNHHPTKVFTYEAEKTRKDIKIIRGERYPLTEAGLKSAMRRAVPKAGVVNFRFHDTRHTAATRALRASNLRVVQNLLGHTDIKTTTKYAHAVDDDLRAALNAISTPSTTKSPTDSDETVDKELKSGNNSD
ncbi:site-specific integrase [Mycoplana rhizolycopersici]|uniref:site-specific integrase n=1 Tax=Mycoplana rhizolycopersici TaxID=2746702 RepID=UPI001FE4982D|nr:tyrosine-type recombinase/integrase [Rhizobium rhizolycopersici]